MKILAIGLAFLFSLISSQTTFAADGSSGCGAGWYILKDNSLVSSSFRNATNMTFSNTFAMTSGTSNCAKHSIVDAAKQSLHFADANYESIMVDAARGNGETIAAFSETFGCSWQGLGDFQNLLHANYQTIFPAGQRSPGALVEAIRDNMQANPRMLKVCTAA